jgi:hypothetical protein
MSCNCHKTGVAAAADPIGPDGKPIKKKPCSPCEAAARAIVSATPGYSGVPLPPRYVGAPRRVAGASEDLLTIQAFLQTLSTSVAPTEPALSQAQAAAGDLSVQLAVAQAAPRSISVGLMIVGAVAVGAGAAYLLSGKSRR